MSCEAGGKSGRTCETHGLPLYPDGYCNEGRDAMAKSIHEIPTPRSEFAPVSLPPSTERPSHVRIATTTKDRERALERLRTMKREYGATFRAHGLEEVLAALEQEG